MKRLIVLLLGALALCLSPVLAFAQPATPPSYFTPTQVSCGTSATLVVAARANRQLLSIVNTTTTAIYLGGSGVTTSTGHLLAGVIGASITLPFTGAMYCVVASSTATVTEAETY